MKQCYTKQNFTIRLEKHPLYTRLQVRCSALHTYNNLVNVWINDKSHKKQYLIYIKNFQYVDWDWENLFVEY